MVCKVRSAVINNSVRQLVDFDGFDADKSVNRYSNELASDPGTSVCGVASADRSLSSSSVTRRAQSLSSSRSQQPAVLPAGPGGECREELLLTNWHLLPSLTRDAPSVTRSRVIANTPCTVCGHLKNTWQLSLSLNACPHGALWSFVISFIALLVYRLLRCVYRTPVSNDCILLKTAKLTWL